MQAYLSSLAAAGQVRVINREVDPRFELAAVTRAAQQEDERVTLFNKVKGTRLPVATNLYGSRKRLCDIAGAANGNFCRRWVELAEQLAALPASRMARPAGDPARTPARLGELPLITYFEKDGGPYFTSAIYLARHPDTGVHNLSFHRSQYISDQELRVRIGTTHDLNKYVSAAEQRGESLPAALLIGVAPEIFVAACASLRTEEDELAAAALIRGSPIETVSCRTINLQVPADTQIVVEGRFLANERRPEGPFGEFMGYYVPMGDNHVFEVSAVSLAQNAVFHSLLCGSPEDMYPLDLATAARIYRHLVQQVPGVINVACYPFIMNTVVQIRQEYAGHAREVLRAAVDANHDYSKTCMVVDEDVDLYNLNDVWWAYLTRGRADQRAEILHDLPGFYRDPHKDHWGRLLIDATKPFHRMAEFERKRIPGADGIRLSDYTG
ncbi:MAG: decarboxylase [Gammaproteobacteria bacterium RIFCSPLOWO2_02_FULL_61_13]|nr:MAG: decarboxylase [Gammaproteobacteria bacterium RIFCSPLOWO2_02_FULL_61_13]